MGESLLKIISSKYADRKSALLCKSSKVEKHFAKLLNEAGIFYWREKCCYNKYGRWCYIDFYIPMYKIAVELDGPEHNSQRLRNKDAVKTEFLVQERGITTVRILNRDCLKMKSVSIIELIKMAGLNRTDEKQIAYKKKQRQEEVKQISQMAGFDILKEVWLYDKTKDFVFRFKDLYIAKHSTGIDYKYLISALKNNQDIHTSQLFIMAFTEDELHLLIDKYYESIWNKKESKTHYYGEEK